jgi:hypothetical protein
VYPIETFEIGNAAIYANRADGSDLQLKTRTRGVWLQSGPHLGGTSRTKDRWPFVPLERFAVGLHKYDPWLDSGPNPSSERQRVDRRKPRGLTRWRSELGFGRAVRPVFRTPIRSSAANCSNPPPACCFIRSTRDFRCLNYSCR